MFLGDLFKFSKISIIKSIYGFAISYDDFDSSRQVEGESETPSSSA